MTDCVFCRIAQNSIPSYKVYEDQNILAFLDIGPVSKGHTLVIPKEHFATIDQCPADVLANLAAKLGIIAKAVTEAVGADAYNVLCNNGKAAGQIVEHVHFHIIPRSAGDGVFTQWPAGKYADGEAQAIAAKISDLLKK